LDKITLELLNIEFNDENKVEDRVEENERHNSSTKKERQMMLFSRCIIIMSLLKFTLLLLLRFNISKRNESKFGQESG
jgi:hypothetical protein